MGVDDTTFVTGNEPLHFFVDLKGDIKDRIIALIKEGGGHVTTDYRDAVIVVTDKGVADSDSKIFLPPTFVEDSIAFGQQAFQDYSLPTAKSGIDAFSGRTHYTDIDDKHILSFIAAHPNSKPTGNTLWHKMERAKVTKHTWHSMRSHYLKTLLPKTKNGDVILTKKKKRSQNDTENTYKAFPTPEPKAKQATPPSKDKENQDTENNSLPLSPPKSPSPQDSFNADINNENVQDLLEHLLNSEDPPPPKAKTTEKSSNKPKPSTGQKKSNSQNGTLHTKNSTTNSTSTSKKSTQAHANLSTFKTPSQRPHSQLDDDTPSQNSNTDFTPQFGNKTNAHDENGEYVHHRVVYSTTKKRAATEKNMRGTAKRVRHHIETLAQDLEIPVTLVYHAHLVNSGDSVKALNYLLANPLEEDEHPWLPNEDKVLKGSHNTEALQKIMKRHGKENCIERTNFLESSTVSLKNYM